MQDLLLWRYLRQPTLPPPAILLPLLKQLAEEALNQRLAFFGVIDRLLGHADEGIREAGVRILAGARGVPAWKHMVAALKDPELAVRLAAVESLQKSALLDPARWVHALYHPDPAVRQHADDIGAPAIFADFFNDPSSFHSWETTVPEVPEINEGEPLPNELYLDAQDALANPTPDNLALLESLLNRGTHDDRHNRTWIADGLSANGKEELVLPVLLAGFSPELGMVTPDTLEVAVRGLVASGNFAFEYQFTGAIGNRAWSNDDQKAFEVLVSQASDINTRYWARDRMAPSFHNALKLGRLARAFAWGVEIGKLLTGEVFQMEMLVNETQLGYTRLRANKLYITPLPILRMERSGPDVVRGLILHEYGHHLYHKGPEAEAVWAQADTEGLGQLLNLVADEHLERNLRQRSRRYGNLLKILNAYAFQYNSRDVYIRSLLNYLGPNVAKVLPRMPLRVSHKFGHVLVNSGRFLREMADQGHSFTRFLRALRMGTGNRSGDPRVAEALSLFKGAFRKSSMAQMLVIARRLREIFGDESNILNDFGQDRAMAGDEMEWLANGGISADSMRQAVDGLLNAKALSGGGGQKRRPEGLGGSGLNLRPEETFPLIGKVVKVAPNAARHADYARRVARAARQLRRYFQDLGLGLAKDKGRLHGQRLDRGRIRALVLKGDPRMLVSRKMARLTDLFLGVAIDCSGSMAGEKLEKARLFGALLAEALKGQRGVDLRLFGFTDRTIYDAGDARRSAVESLESLDGNNDAAALWHVYRIARASRRQAKLLVMISDGLPSECSVAALKALVRRLGRWGCCAAQVAVQPLQEICFPHYVLLTDQAFDVAVRKFGEVVIRLVGTALGKR